MRYYKPDRTCHKCKTPNAFSKVDIHIICEACRLESKERYRLQAVQKSKRYYLKNKERIDKRNKKYSTEYNKKPENKEKLKQYQKSKKYKDRHKERHIERMLKDELYRKRVNARILARSYVNSGRLVRKPCVVCGETKAQGHHEDYDKPLEVMWLCRKHHFNLHKGELLATDYPVDKPISYLEQHANLK